MRSHDAMAAKRWRKVLLGMFLALLGMTLTGLPESRAQYFAHRSVLPPREIDTEKIWLDRFLAAQRAASPQAPASYNTPDGDLYMHSYSYQSYYPGGESQRPTPSPAGPSPYGISPAELPWNQASLDDYNELPPMPQDLPLGEPKKYLLVATPLPQASPAERPFAVLIAHLPDNAVFWVEETRTRSTGRTRYFQSPPLGPDLKYTYRVRAAWIEDGHWVSQTRLVHVEAGLIQAIYLRPALSAPAKAAMKSLSK